MICVAHVGFQNQTTRPMMSPKDRQTQILKTKNKNLMPKDSKDISEDVVCMRVMMLTKMHGGYWFRMV